MTLRLRYCLSVLTLLVIGVLTAGAEEFWVKKDWKQWSKDDCAKMLQDSPWTKRWAKSQVASHQMPGVSGANQEGASAENAPEMHYVIQLRSSLPVREAVVRLQQIQLKYDKMSAAEKKDFDAKAEALLNRDYGDVILVHVEYGSNLQSFEREMSTYWKAIPPESPPNDMYLINERGDHAIPARFISPANGSYTFDLAFARTKDKEPFVRDGDKLLSLQFTHPAVGIQTQTITTNPSGPSMDIFGEERVLIQFKLDKMTIAGKPSL